MLPAGSDVLHCRSPTKSTPLDMFNCSASAGVLQVRKRTWPKKPTGRIAKQRRDVPPTPGTSIASIGSSTTQTRAGGPPFFRAGHSSQDKELLQELTAFLSAECQQCPCERRVGSGCTSRTLTPIVGTANSWCRGTAMEHSLRSCSSARGARRPWRWPSWTC